MAASQAIQEKPFDADGICVGRLADMAEQLAQAIRTRGKEVDVPKVLDGMRAVHDAWSTYYQTVCGPRVDRDWYGYAMHIAAADSKAKAELEKWKAAS